MFRSLNKGATKEQAIAAIGEIVSRSLGLDIEAVRKKAVAAASTASDGKPTFIPAGGGSRSSGAASTAQDNLYAQMADEFLTEDAG